MKVCSRFVFGLVFLLAALTANSQSKEQSPQRIISAGGSVTEILHHLGLSQKLIAIDTSSQYPAEVQQLPKVGYFRALSAEGVLSLAPSLLVGAKGAGPAAALKQIEGVGVKVKLFDQLDYTLSSWKALVEDIGYYFAATSESQALIESEITRIEQLKSKRKYRTSQINAVSFLSLGQRGPMVAGQNTMPNFLFNQAGLNNLGAAVDGYKPINNESLMTEKIDLIFIPSHLQQALGGKKAICSNPVIKLALHDGCNVIVMDGLLLMGMGARISLALEKVVSSANQLKLPSQ